MAVDPVARRFEAPPGGVLTEPMQAAFDEDGFLVLENFVSGAACDRLRARMSELIDAFEPSTVSSVFSTTDQGHAADRYFRDSGDRISFFFEADAFDGTGRMIRNKHAALNKVGHALHDLDPVFDAFCRTPELAAVVRSAGVTDAGLMQSMYIFKPPHIGGEVTCHQDATFLHTEPQSCLGLWFALEDATIRNGCMSAIPGGHNDGLKSRFQYKGDDLAMTVLDPSPWPDEGHVALEAPKGTLVLLHGLLPHLSGANTSPKSRHAFALHVVDRAARWSPDNWLRRAADMPVRGFS